MNIKLTSPQMVEALGLSISKGTLVAWTRRGYVKGDRTTTAKRGGNFTYTMEELRRIKDAIKAHGAQRLPESLTEGYVPPPPRVVRAVSATNGAHKGGATAEVEALHEIRDVLLRLLAVWESKDDLK